MIGQQAVAFAIAAVPQTGVKSANVAALEIDTQKLGVKYNYLTIIYEIGSTDTAHTVLKVQETDTTGSGYVDVANATFAAALPGAGAGNTVYIFQLDIRARARFQKLLATLAAGSVGASISAIAILSRGSELPVTNAQKGVAGQVYV